MASLRGVYDLLQYVHHQPQCWSHCGQVHGFEAVGKRWLARNLSARVCVCAELAHTMCSFKAASLLSEALLPSEIALY